MRRKVGLLLIVGAMVPLAVASTAWACASLAKLSADSRIVSPGQSITVTGSGYSDTHAGTNAGDSDVTIRLGGRKGRVLGSAVADASRRISTTLRVPSGVSPGWYVLTATQFNANGTPKAGMPGRFAIRVQGASAAGAVVSPWSSTNPSGPAASATPVAGDSSPSPLPLLLGMMLVLSLLAGGFTLAGRRSQSFDRSPLGV